MSHSLEFGTVSDLDQKDEWLAAPEWTLPARQATMLAVVFVVLTVVIGLFH